MVDYSLIGIFILATTMRAYPSQAETKFKMWETYEGANHDKEPIQEMVTPLLPLIPKNTLDSAPPSTLLDAGENNYSIFKERDSRVSPAITPHGTTYEPSTPGFHSKTMSSSSSLFLKQAVVACGRILKYFRANILHMNLDAIMGTRIAEEQFRRGLVDPWKGDTILNNLMLCNRMADMKRLLATAAWVSNTAEVLVRRDETLLYQSLWALVQDGFWNVTLLCPPLSVLINDSASLVLSGHEALNGRQTDQCLASVLHQNGCIVTKECWEMMGTRIYSGYSLTHQVLFLIAGVQVGCKDWLDGLAAGIGYEGGVSALLARLCSIVLSEANVISEADFPEYRRDLFMEQGALCGLLGYRIFFQKSWVVEVLSWQHKLGCYGSSDHQEIQPSPNPSPPNSSHTRVRQNEVMMPGSCLSHRSAVALGYLSVFTHHMSVDMYTNSH